MRQQIVRGPLDYLLKSPGKDIRRKFIHAFNEWLRIPEEKLNIITEIVGLLHTASLLYVPLDSDMTEALNVSETS